MGVSGIYYLSKPSYGDKVITALNFEFIEDKAQLNVHYDQNVPPATKDVNYKNYKKLKYLSFRGISFGNAALESRYLPIEKDVYFLLHPDAEWKMDSENCAEVVFSDPDNKSFIAGKNIERVKEIVADKELYNKLVRSALEKYCIAYNQDIAYQYASKYPFPEPGMKDANVVAAATEGIKKQAAIAKWDEKIDYCYIKSNDWTVIKHKVTGEILYRTLRLIAVMSVGNECKWEEFSVKQDYQGGSWGKTTYNGNTQLIIPIDCSESKKYK